MGKKSASAPSYPDPTAMATAQSAANKEAVTESAKVNQINEVTPYGNLTYSGEIGSPDRTRTMTLTPDAQSAYDYQQGLTRDLAQFGQNYAGRITSDLSQPFTMDGLPAVSGLDDIMGQAQKTGDAFYQRSYNMLQPEMDRQATQFEATLLNRGIMPGSQEYNDQMRSFNDQRGRTLNDLALGAQQQAGGEQSRLYGLEQSARNQALNEALLGRTQGINELSALLQGAPSIGTPSFGQAAQYQVAPADVMGAQQGQYLSQQNAYNQQTGANNAALGGLYGLGSAALSTGFWL